MASSRAGTPATRVLTDAGVDFAEHAYRHDPSAPSYGPEAAAALGVPAGSVFKTLVVQGPSGLAVGVVPVERRLDVKAMAQALGVKSVAMAPVAEAERSSGYVAGGISPLGQRRALPTVLDDSARRWPRVYVSGGRRGFDVSVAPEDLARLTGAAFAPIAAQGGEA